MGAGISSIRIDSAIEGDIALYFKKYLKGVSRLSFEKYLHDTLSLQRAEEQFMLLHQKLPVSFSGKKILEIGSGFGIFLINIVKNHGVIASGIEPDQICYTTSREIFAQNGIPSDIVKHEQGERLSYPSDYFDVVYSSNVLEHVGSPKQVLGEAIRVLKPAGYLFFVVPNYASWWEGHYGILWPPNIPKRLASLYVRLLGRDPSFLDSLHLITLKNIKDMVAEFDTQLEVLDWGWDTWEYRLASLDFSGWAALHHLKKLLSVLQGLKVLSAVRYFGRQLDWLTPVILLAKKHPVQGSVSHAAE
jgi:SAM-dependent methyltransferase